MSNKVDNERAVIGCAILIAFAVVCTGIGGIFGYPVGLICFGGVTLWRFLTMRFRPR